MFDSYQFYLDRKKIAGYYSTKGYNIVTFRMLLVENFGYKNGEAITNDIGARPSLLNARLVYKDEELFDLKTKVADLIEYIRVYDADHRRWWCETRSVLFDTSVYSSSGVPWQETRKKLVGMYEIRERFKMELGNIIKSLINDGEQERYFF